MQVSVVLAVGGSHGRDLLPPADALPAADEHRIQMPVKRIDVSNVAILPIGMAHDDHVPPPEVDVPRKHHDAVSDAENRVFQIGVAAANAVPIFADMASRPETARLV